MTAHPETATPRTNLDAAHDVCEQALAPIDNPHIVTTIALELRARLEALTDEVASLTATGPAGDRDRAAATTALRDARTGLRTAPSSTRLADQITHLRRLAWSCRALAWSCVPIRTRASTYWWVEASGTSPGSWRPACVNAWTPRQAAQHILTALDDRLSLQSYARRGSPRAALIEVWPTVGPVTIRPPGPPVLQLHSRRERPGASQ